MGEVRDEPWTFTSKSLVLSFSDERLVLDYTTAAYVVISSPLISITAGKCLILLSYFNPLKNILKEQFLY